MLILLVHSVCLQISLGPFSDLPAFEIQTIASNNDNISMLGEASQVGVLPLSDQCSADSCVKLPQVVY